MNEWFYLSQIKSYFGLYKTYTEYTQFFWVICIDILNQNMFDYQILINEVPKS